MTTRRPPAGLPKLSRWEAGRSPSVGAGPKALGRSVESHVIPAKAGIQIAQVDPR